MRRVLVTGMSGTGKSSALAELARRFDAVVLLSAPPDVVLDRIRTRTTNDYGKTQAERDLIVADIAETEPRLRATATHELDATQPLQAVVAALVAIGVEG